MLESRAAYGWYRDYGVTGETAPLGTDCTVRKMPYREYKRKYSDCTTVSGSYNKNEKTIEVYIPNGRDYDVTGETAPSETDCTVRRLPYREYKRKYNDCATVTGSYNVEEKTIEVYIPNERIKPSGMRDQKIDWYVFWFSVDGEVFSTYYMAVNESNAAKRFKADCKRYHWEVSEFVRDCREYDRYASFLPRDLLKKVFKYAEEEKQ